jgi:IS30 family transposase
MNLKPMGPPGRSTRKARAFEAEIGRLSRQGYNSEAIREALALAGVNVSRATVRREMRRHEEPKPG